MDDIVERVKQANKIEDVIEETGYHLESKRGRYIRCREHNSLVVDTNTQTYSWNSQSEIKGDVIEWLMKRRGYDFKTAVEELARRAHLPEPGWGRQDNVARLAARAREDAFAVANNVFWRWLQADPEALAYCRGRGWMDATIQESGVGFSGRNTAAEVREMRGELSLNGVDLDGAEAVAILGWRGDVTGWAAAHQVDLSGQENWVEWGFIPGLMGKTRIVYPHIVTGRIRTFSARNILGAETNREGREVKAFNLPVALSGERQVFFNQAYGMNAEECVIVEGQADAITLGQWGLAAAALAGTAWADHGPLLATMRQRHATLYIGLDGDEAGQKALIGRRGEWPLVELLGPMARVVRWPTAIFRSGKTVKDANDWLQWFQEQGTGVEEQGQLVRQALDAADPMVVEAAKWAGRQAGAKHDAAVKQAVAIVAQMDKLLSTKYRQKLADALKVGLRDFQAMLRTATGEKQHDDEQPVEVAETLGGFYPVKDGDGKKGWLIEYLYDPDKDEALLAYRDPEGRVDTANYIDLNGIRYIPKSPNSLIRNKGVLFPSKLGTLKTTRELVAIIESFIHKNYLLDDRFFGRMAAYYVLLTWVYDCFNAIPYLRAVGDYGSGKSELMKRIGHVCYRMMTTGGAGTAASLFRALEQYKGTAFMDEMDLQDGGDMANDLIKILNMGAMKGNPVWRMDPVTLADGTKTYEVTAYNIFGPKLIAMRKDFRDQAVSSRCLTIKLMGKESLELKLRGVKLHLDEEFYQHALNIRNLLLRWRLARWQAEIQVSEDLMDLEVPARLNQVTMPLKAIAQDDPMLMADIVSFVRGLNEELVLERNMGIDARVMEALIAIRENPKYSAYLFNGPLDGYEDCQYVFTKHASKVCNEIIDEMNTADDDHGEDDKHRKAKGTTSQSVGRIARQTLQLPSRRRTAGYVIVLDNIKMQVLKKKYGLDHRNDMAAAEQPTETTTHSGRLL